MFDFTRLQKDPYKTRPVNSLAAIRSRNLTENHLGRTAGGRFTYASMIGEHGDDFPPDSKYWSGQAKASLNYLVDMLGAENYRAWFDLTWPAPTIEALTWRTIRDLAEAAITAAEAGERDIRKLAQAAHDRLAQLIKENA